MDARLIVQAHGSPARKTPHMDCRYSMPHQQWPTVLPLVVPARRGVLGVSCAGERPAHDKRRGADIGRDESVSHARHNSGGIAGGLGGVAGVFRIDRRGVAQSGHAFK